MHATIKKKYTIGGNRKTHKAHSIRKPPIKMNDFVKRKEGWIQITIKGEPYERGFQHGHLLSHQFSHIKTVLAFLVKTFFDITLTAYIEQCAKLIKPKIMSEYPEFFEEIRGISEGANVTIDFLIGWNSLLSMYSYYDNIPPIDIVGKRCSAFIACGDATKDGKIVMAHNTHSDYASGPLANISIHVIPSTGYPFVMQTYAGYIASGTDWFICSTGIIGCETTISDTNYKPEFGTPYFCRIRQAMQYATTLEEYSDILTHDNAGDYACSWLFGDINKNRIMLCELGLNYNNIQITSNGVYYGMNSAMDFSIRNMETNDIYFTDLEDSSGARNSRLQSLLMEKYYGKIDIDIAKKIVSDHYDSFLHKTQKNKRSICKHSELDSSSEEPFYPWGCVDGKVTNTDMAKNMSFIGRMGAACGTPFYSKSFLKKHPIYNNWKHVLRNMPRQKWIKL